MINPIYTVSTARVVACVNALAGLDPKYVVDLIAAARAWFGHKCGGKDCDICCELEMQIANLDEEKP